MSSPDDGEVYESVAARLQSKFDAIDVYRDQVRQENLDRFDIYVSAYMALVRLFTPALSVAALDPECTQENRRRILDGAELLIDLIDQSLSKIASYEFSRNGEEQ